MFRALQGFFGGGLQPTQQAIILDTFKPSQRSAAPLPCTTIATIVAPVLGPTLGGWITDNYSWRWVFFINIPVGDRDVPCRIIWSRIPLGRRQARAGALRTDYVGVGFIVLGLGCLQVMLDRGEDDDWFESSVHPHSRRAGCGRPGRRRVLADLRQEADRRPASLQGSQLRCRRAADVRDGNRALREHRRVLQLAQRQYSYTATWAGLVLSPGAAC